MPVIKRAVLLWIELDDVGWSGIGMMIEKQQVNTSAVFRKDTEIDSLLGHGCADWERLPGLRRVNLF